jgi:hypothetical protein
MVAELLLYVEVAGCPTVCRHCWAQGTPYRAMPVAELAARHADPVGQRVHFSADSGRLLWLDRSRR